VCEFPMTVSFCLSASKKKEGYTDLGGMVLHDRSVKDIDNVWINNLIKRS